MKSLFQIDNSLRMSHFTFGLINQPTDVNEATVVNDCANECIGRVSYMRAPAIKK